MTNDFQTLQFEGQDVEFDLSGKNLKLNATKIGALFSKVPSDYIRLDRAKTFIDECLRWAELDNADYLKQSNSPFSGVNVQEDLIIQIDQMDVWMNRIIAVDYAAWLDPRFAAWLNIVMDRLLRGHRLLPNSFPDVNPERKQLIQAIEEDEEKMKEYEATPAYQEAKETRKRLTKNRHRLKLIEREAVNQYILFMPDANV